MLNGDPKTDLPLSAVPSPDLELARDQAYIELELARVDRLKVLGFASLADRAVDRLIDTIIAPPSITELELRLMDGNR
jgi:hypothetical protein